MSESASPANIGIKRSREDFESGNNAKARENGKLDADGESFLHLRLDR